ncbi:hypothetical protein [Terriglobus sp. TAA 43]|uniref:hypothetical protein n=1 Tax=Terriglobus sp. TAA 43 TaxID=278961 RepID=UPI000646EF84|nr:hypothetical protein [Terriglobus sp. TAA 43]
MTNSSQTLADALKALEGQVVESYVDGWKSYWKLVTDVARDPSSLQAAQKEYLNHVVQTVPGNVSKTFQAGARVYGALVQSGGQLASELYTRTAQDVTKAATAAATTAETVAARVAEPVAPSEFIFEGYAEETLSKRFLVSNKSPQPVSVALEISSFTPDTEGASVQVNVTPQTFSLGTNEENVVTCAVTIPASLTPMQDHRAVLSAPGLPSLSIGLHVRSMGERDVVVEDAPPG